MLYYDEYGSKENPTIMLLHGAGALDTFCRQYCFSDKYHLVVPHLAGAGKAATEIYDPEKTTEELFMLIKSLHKKANRRNRSFAWRSDCNNDCQQAAQII